MTPQTQQTPGSALDTANRAEAALDNAYGVYFAAQSARDAARDAYYAADRALSDAKEASRDARAAYRYSLDNYQRIPLKSSI